MTRLMKIPPIVSTAIRELPKKVAIDCTLRAFGCREQSEYTVLAHLRGKWALGMAEKPHDFFAVFACDRCHDALDGRRDEQISDFDVLRALYESQTIMAHNGVLRAAGDSFICEARPAKPTRPRGQLKGSHKNTDLPKPTK